MYGTRPFHRRVCIRRGAHTGLRLVAQLPRSGSCAPWSSSARSELLSCPQSAPAAKQARQHFDFKICGSFFDVTHRHNEARPPARPASS